MRWKRGKAAHTHTLSLSWPKGMTVFPFFPHCLPTPFSRGTLQLSLCSPRREAGQTSEPLQDCLQSCELQAHREQTPLPCSPPLSLIHTPTVCLQMIAQSPASTSTKTTLNISQENYWNTLAANLSMPWDRKENRICEDVNLRPSEEGKGSLCLVKFIVLEGIKEHQRIFKTPLLCRASTEISILFPGDPSVLLQHSSAFNQNRKELPCTQTWSISIAGQGINSSLSSAVPWISSTTTSNFLSGKRFPSMN